MFQDISPYVYDPIYVPAKPEDDSLVIFTDRHCPLLKGEESIALPTATEAQAAGADRESMRFLFSISGRLFFLCREESAAERLKEQGYRYQKMSEFRNAAPVWMVFAAATGAQLGQWYKRHRFCGSCGAPMKHSDRERMIYCEHCNEPIYPKICPAVIVGIIDRKTNRIVVSRYADGRRASVALIAGFAETGETIEETVHREVMEEVGLKVKNLRFYKSQPWTFTDSLLFGFFCELDGDAELTIDKKELAEAMWMSPEEIPEDEHKLSLTREMLDCFKYGRAAEK